MANRWHTRPKDAAAQTRAKQYASSEHRQLRAAARRRVDAGNGRCWRCGNRIAPHAKFHLGHDDIDRTVYRGEEHPLCNLTAAAKAGRAKQRQGQVKRAQSRRW